MTRCINKYVTETGYQGSVHIIILIQFERVLLALCRKRFAVIKSQRSFLQKESKFAVLMVWNQGLTSNEPDRLSIFRDDRHHCGD